MSRSPFSLSSASICAVLCAVLGLLWGEEGFAAEKSGGEGRGPSTSPITGKSGSKEPSDDPTKKKPPEKPETPKGDFHKRAIGLKDKSTDLIDARESKLRADVNSMPASGTCTAANCDNARGTAASAGSGATDIANTAQDRERIANQERQDIFQAIERGQRAGEYGPQHVNQLNNLFADGASRPKDAQLDSLHQKLQDPAYALRTNQDHINQLKETQQEYSRVAQSAQEMGKKLNTNEKRNDSLGTAVSARRSQAAYPTSNAAYPTSAKKDFSTADRKFGRYSGSAELGGTSDDNPFSSPHSGGRGERNSDGTLASGGGNGVPGATDGKNGAVAKGKGEAKADGEKDVSEGEKLLNNEGKALLAGMLKELQDDLKNGGRSGEHAPPPKGPNGELGNPITERGLASVKDNTILGGAILSLTKEASSSLRTGNDKWATNGTLNDLDLLGIDKSLFRRVNEALRKKTSSQGGLQ